MNIPMDDLNLAIGSRTQYALGRTLERMGFRAAAEEAYLSSLMLDSRHQAAWQRLRRSRDAAAVDEHATAAVAPGMDLALKSRPAARAARFF